MKFSPSSTARMLTCDDRLQRVLLAAIEDTPVDFGIACGHRGKADQDKACAEGKSDCPWPTSKHNSEPSMAFDYYPVIGGRAAWDNEDAFRDVAHHIFATADRMGVNLRWGGTWTSSADDPLAKRRRDMPHIELKG